MPPKIKPKPNAPKRGAAIREAQAAAAAAAAAAETASASGSATPAEGSIVAPSSAPAAASIGEMTTNTVTTGIITSRAIAPPIGRLDSLRSKPPTPAPGGAAVASAVRGKQPLKFKPKAGIVRKSAEERAAMEKQVAHQPPPPSRDEDKAALSTRGRGDLASRGPRGRGSGMMGRGRARVEVKVKEAPSTASGAFSLGSVISGRTKVIIERTGGEEEMERKKKKEVIRTSSVSDKKSETKGEEGEEGVKKEEDQSAGVGYVFSSSDEVDSDGPRVNVERLSEFVFDSGDEEMDIEEGASAPLAHRDNRKPPPKMPAMFPLRVERYKHEEKAAPSPIFKDDKRKRRGLKQEDSDNEVMVKPEPLEDDLILPDAPSIPPIPPEQRRVSIAKPPLSSPDASKKPPHRRKPSSSKKRRPSVFSPAEEEEIRRDEEERVMTLKELGVHLPTFRALDGAEIEMADVSEGESNPKQISDAGIKAGDLFFFQFPAVLPTLAPLEQEPEESIDKLKEKQIGEIEAQIKSEQGTSQTSLKRKQQQQQPSSFPIRAPGIYQQAKLPSGLAGQLRVHKSGKISILWGRPEKIVANTNTNAPPPEDSRTVGVGAPTTRKRVGESVNEPIHMNLIRGTDCEFLQEVVAVKPESDFVSAAGEEKGKGKAVSFGQVKGRFVVSPDWEKLLLRVK